MGILPPYLADMCGAKNATSIYGRVLTGWAAACLIGPRMMTYLRESAYTEQLTSLAGQVAPDKFAAAFGAPVTELPTLIKAKAVTIPRLLELLPPDTPNPTYVLYDSTLYTFAGVVAMGLVANGLVRPVPSKYFVTGSKPPPPPA